MSRLLSVALFLGTLASVAFAQQDDGVSSQAGQLKTAARQSFLLADTEQAKKHLSGLLALYRTERASDPMDDLQRKEEIDLTARSLSTVRGRQRQIELALERLETGDYGVCEDCGDPISPKRLQAAPWALLCVGCQEVAERETQAA